ncbi:hypothetical protein [Pseudomonas phage PA26]|uniref:Uncharacterized protein n=1 Tax=Pseudomonas phage PA26 TaxID=1204542 RepID=I7DMQ1_9CAUD|nr:hypothetical protein FDH24_gp29 [Pseudomonas phage PA26]AFO70528.1 hypothetical protein [Pseudomonas phage PA26]WJZ48960.1 hypothetical protein [Pseudomonas phage PA15]WRN92344.1 hypothetical protein [Pseudomonas phage vB_Pae_HMKU_23]
MISDELRKEFEEEYRRCVRSFAGVIITQEELASKRSRLGDYADNPLIHGFFRGWLVGRFGTDGMMYLTGEQVIH